MIQDTFHFMRYNQRNTTNVVIPAERGDIEFAA